MSDRVDAFCDSLKRQLNALEERTNSLKDSLKTAPKKAEDALHKLLNQAGEKIESQKQAVAKAKSDVQTWLEQKKSEAKATIDQWKVKHEAKKLIGRAEKAEAYAAAVTLLAQASIDEAEHAALEAALARMDAEAAASKV